MKQVTRYEVREFVGSEYSRQLGRRLRTLVEANRIVRILKKQGRTAFKAGLQVTVQA